MHDSLIERALASSIPDIEAIENALRAGQRNEDPLASLLLADWLMSAEGRASEHAAELGRLWMHLLLEPSRSVLLVHHLCSACTINEEQRAQVIAALTDQSPDFIIDEIERLADRGWLEVGVQRIGRQNYPERHESFLMGGPAELEVDHVQIGAEFIESACKAFLSHPSSIPSRKRFLNAILSHPEMGEPPEPAVSGMYNWREPESPVYGDAMASMAGKDKGWRLKRCYLLDAAAQLVAADPSLLDGELLPWSKLLSLDGSTEGEDRRKRIRRTLVESLSPAFHTLPSQLQRLLLQKGHGEQYAQVVASSLDHAMLRDALTAQDERSRHWFLEGILRALPDVPQDLLLDVIDTTLNLARHDLPQSTAGMYHWESSPVFRLWNALLAKAHNSGASVDEAISRAMEQELQKARQGDYSRPFCDALILYWLKHPNRDALVTLQADLVRRWALEEEVRPRMWAAAVWAELDHNPWPELDAIWHRLREDPSPRVQEAMDDFRQASAAWCYDRM